MNRGCLIGLIAFLVIATIGLGVYFYQQRTKSTENFENGKTYYHGHRQEDGGDR